MVLQNYIGSWFIIYFVFLHRYNYCKDNLTPYLRKCGFNPAKDLKFMPCSGLTGAGLLDPVGEIASWYKWVLSIFHLIGLVLFLYLPIRRKVRMLVSINSGNKLLQLYHRYCSIHIGWMHRQPNCLHDLANFNWLIAIVLLHFRKQKYFWRHFELSGFLCYHFGPVQNEPSTISMWILRSQWVMYRPVTPWTHLLFSLKKSICLASTISFSIGIWA